MSKSNPYAASSKAKTVTPDINEENKELEVPSGTVAEVTAWVGDDEDRAKAALKAENDGAKRVTLTHALEEIINKKAE